MSEETTTNWKQKKQAMARDEIKHTALTLLKEGGFENLSMHNIARKMQTTTPALYYYYKNRDTLIAELSADALAALEVQVRQTLVDHQNEALIRQAYLVISAYYNWGRQNPAQYQLLYGSPIPGYNPPEALAEKITQTITFFLEICEKAVQANMLKIPVLALTPEMRRELQAFGTAMAVDLPPEVIFTVVTGWAKLHGMISSEINGFLPQVLTNIDRTFFLEARQLLEQVGFDYQRTA
jgi:AcrR family transcriptional regulator